MRTFLQTPPRFSFQRTVLSHGWYSLAPFRLEGQGRARALRTTVALESGGAEVLRLSPGDGCVVLEAPGRPAASTRHGLEAAARRILNLDLDLREFYRQVRSRADTRWMAGVGAGRLLRSPDLFEDLLKLVLTTNCSWAFTTRMVRSLVELFGEQAKDGTRAFPGPRTLARLDPEELRDRVRVGYRAGSVAALSERVAHGRLHPETWENAGGDDRELRAELLELPGVGPYVAENLLRLLGRPLGLGLDSWLRAKYARVYHGGRKVRDRTIARRYAWLGRWSGLALWCDMTRDWFDGEPPPDGWARVAREVNP